MVIKKNRRDESNSRYYDYAGQQQSTVQPFDISECLSAIDGKDLNRLSNLIRSKTRDELNVSRDEFGWTLLMICANRNLLSFVKYLENIGIDVNAQSGVEKLTAISLATRNGDLEMIQLLLSLNAQPEIPDKRGWTSLHWASVQGHLEAMNLFTPRMDVLVDAQDFGGGHSALHWAAKNGKVDCVKFLVEKGSNINMRNFSNRTAREEVLYQMSSNQWLISAKNSTSKFVSSTIKRDTDEMCECLGSELSSSVWSIVNGHVLTIELLTSGAMQLDVSLAPQQGEDDEALKKLKEVLVQLDFFSKANELMFFCVKNPENERSLELLKKAIKRGANVNAVEESTGCIGEGFTPLIWASIAGSAETAKILLSAGARVDEPVNGDKGKTAVCFALSKGREKVCEVLRDFSANFQFSDFQSTSDEDAVVVAIVGGNPRCVRIAIEECEKAGGRKIVEKILDEREGWNSVLFSASLGRFEIIKELIQGLHANPLVKDKRGRDAFLVAVANGKIETAIALFKFFDFSTITGGTRDSSGWCSVTIACRNEKLESADLKLLISETTQSVDISDEAEMTPLMHAAEAGRDDLCEVLLSIGADYTIVSKHCKTASAYAKDAGFSELALSLSEEVRRSRERSIHAGELAVVSLATMKFPNLEVAALPISRPSMAQSNQFINQIFPGVRVENLHSSITSLILENYFVARGVAVKKALVVVNPLTGDSKKYGYLVLPDKLNMQLALKENGQKMLHDLKVKIFADDSLCNEFVFDEKNIKFEKERKIRKNFATFRENLISKRREKFAKEKLSNERISRFLFHVAVEASILAERREKTSEKKIGT